MKPTKPLEYYLNLPEIKGDGNKSNQIRWAAMLIDIFFYQITLFLQQNKSHQWVNF